MMEEFWYFLFDTAYSDYIRFSLWGYPIFETLHLIGVALLFGSIALTDLRMLGCARTISASRLTGGFLLHFTWIGFAIVAFSGISLFMAYAPDNAENPVFIVKMLLIVAAGINAVFFHLRVYSGIADWDVDRPSPLAARLSTGLSMTLWILTVAAGRLIAYPDLFV